MSKRLETADGRSTAEDRARQAPGAAPLLAEPSQEAISLIQCQKDALEMVVRGEPIERLLDFLARWIEGLSRGRFVVAIHLMEADGYHFGHVEAPSLPAKYATAAKGMDARLELGCCSSAVVSRTSMIVHDFAAETRWPAFSGGMVALGLRGCFTTPILSPDNRVLGTFAIYYREPREPSPHDRQLADVVTGTVGLAIERRQTEGRLEADLADTKLLQRVSAEIIQEQNGHIFDRIVDAAVAIMRSDFASMQMHYPERGSAGELRLLAARGFSAEATKFWEWVRADSSCTCGVALKTRQRVIATDVENCDFMAGTEDQATYLQAGIQAVQSTPLLSRSGTLLGMISTHWNKPHEPTERDLRLLDILARQAADLIERKKVDEVLRESEERYRHLVEQTVDGIFVAERDGRYVDVNPAGCALLGMTREEVLSRSLTDVLFPEEHDRLRSAIAAFADDGVHLSEWRFRRKDGSTFIGEVAARELPDGRLQGVVRDITDRVHAEEQLRRNAATLSTLIEQSPLGIYTVDSQFRVAQISAGAMPAFRNVQPVKGRDFAEVMRAIWPEPFASEAIAIFRHTLETGEPYISPGLTEKRKDLGSTESYEWQVNRVTLADGNYGVVCYYFDTTRLQQAAHAMRESEERFRALADNIPQLAWMADGEGWIFWYNRQWFDFTGTTLEQMQGWGWKSVHHPDHIERVVEKVARHFREGLSWEDTFPLRGKDGQYRWFLSRMTPIRDGSGRVVRFFGTNTDVTEQRELQNENAKQAQSLADLHRRKDEFLAMLSHELRNPLAPILNAVQLLRMQKGGTEIQNEAQGTIERQVSQLARLVDDLLEVSRITTGRIHLQEERLDLRGVVELAIAGCRPQCGQKAQTIAKSLPAEPVWVQGDSARLEQVVVNLLNNACKYTDRKGHIWVGLAQKGDEAELRVRDNGIGIAPELLPHIFDLFTQADKSLDRSQGGMGIGLALVKSLVTMHRGRVEAHSTVGQGSEFVLRLPLMLSPERPALERIETEDLPPTHALKVLVVDDNADAAKGIAMLLRAYGHDARVAHEGAAAMQAALEYVPDLVLLDIGLPVINGFQVAQWIRKEPALKNIVLVALTGYGQESDLKRSAEAGFDHHLVKPVDFTKVQAILSAVGEKGS